MANIEVSLPLPAIQNAIQNATVVKRLQNPQPLYKSWALYLERLATNAYAGEKAPFGGAWPALKPATVERKKRLGLRRKALQAAGNLYDSTVAQVVSDGAQIGSNQRVGNYSLLAIHQYGAPRRNIPARRVLPVDDDGNLLGEARTELMELTEDYLFG